MQYTQLLVDIVLGSLTGYITNLFAINMLFRKYLGLGGMIIDTREQFIENVSTLVEREIINNRTIDSELAGDEFRTALRQTVTSFLRHHLYQATGGINIGDIPGLDRTMANLQQLGRARVRDTSEQLLMAVLNHVRVLDLLGPAQLQHLGEVLWDTTREVVREQHLAGTLFQHLYRENKDYPLSRFIEDQVFQTLARNLQDQTAALHRHLADHWDPQIDTTATNIYRQLQIRACLEHLEELVREKPLAEVLGSPETGNLTNQLLARGIRFFRTQPGQKAMHQLAASMINALKGVQTSLLELLQDDLQLQIEQLLARELPPVIQRVILWIKDNQGDIEDLIDQAVDDVLASEASGFWNIKGKIKKAIKDFFWPSLSREYDLVARIIAVLDQNDNVEQLSHQLAGEIIEFIRRNSVGDIVRGLEKNGVLTADLLSSVLGQNLATWAPAWNLSRLDKLFTHPLGQFLPRGRLAEALEKLIWEQIIPWAKTEFLYTEKSTALVQKALTTSLNGLGEKTMAQLVSPGWVKQVTPRAGHWMLAALDRHKAPLVQELVNRAKKQWGELVLAPILAGQTREQMTRALSQWATAQLDRQLDLVATRPLQCFYDPLDAIPHLEDKLTTGLLGLVNRNLEQLLKGQIKNTVQSQLTQLPDDELRVQVEEFMGRELRPITLLGGFLGIFGGALSFYLGGIPTTNWALAVATPLIIYSGIGYGTNALALRMIFRPYHQWRLLGIPIPLTPGVVVQQKPRFALAMGEFVGNELLNQATVQEFFMQRRPELTKQLLEQLTANNNRLLKDIFRSQQPDLVHWMLRQTLLLGREKRHLLAASLTRLLGNFHPAPVIDQIPRARLRRELQQILARQEYVLAAYIEGLLSNEKPVGSLLPDLTRPALDQALHVFISQNIQPLGQWILDDHRWEQWVQGTEPWFDNLTGQTIQALLGSPAAPDKAGWPEQLVQGWLRQLKSPSVQKPIQDFLNNTLAREMHRDRTVQDLFGGRLIEILKNNTGPLLTQITNLVLQFLVQSKPAMVRIIRENIEEKGLFYSFLSDLLDVEHTVRQVVDTLVDDRIPGYLAQQQAGWEEMAGEFIATSIAPVPMDRIGININQHQLGDMVTRLLDHPGTTKVMTQVLRGSLDFVLQMPLKNLLQLVAIHNMDDLYRLFQGEIKELRLDLARQLDHHRIPVQNEAATLAGAILDRHLLSLPLASLTRGMTRDQINRTSGAILARLGASTAVERFLDTGLEQISDTLKQKTTCAILDCHLLRADLERLIQDLTGNGQFHGDLGAVIHYVTELLLENDDPKLFAFLDEATTVYILEILIHSTLGALEDNLAGLIDAVHIKEVTVREINNMNPRQIDLLFDSFARDYFTRLKLYGLSGGIVGLATAAIRSLLP